MKHKKIASTFIVLLMCFGNISLLFSPISMLGDGNSTNIDNNQLDSDMDGLDTSNGDIFEAVWWNATWTYRIFVNITAKSDVNYTDKLVSFNINFTARLEELDTAGTFDNNSIRIIEHALNGDVLYEVPSQFHKADPYDAAANATGLLFWVVNGTTEQDETRIFYIYFDIAEHGTWEAPEYITGLQVAGGSNAYILENDDLRFNLDLTQVGNYYDHAYNIINKHTGRDQQQNGNYDWGWMIYWWYYGGYDTNRFNLIDSLEVLYSGPVCLVMKMTHSSSQDFNYERYYTLNYLDDTVKIQHQITAVNQIADAGEIRTASWWTLGETSQTAPNSAYGLGGWEMSNPNALGDEFTSTDYLRNEWGGGVNHIPNAAVKEEAWIAQWNEDPTSDMEGIGVVWDNDDSADYLSEIGRSGGSSDEGRQPYMYYTPPPMDPGDSIEFINWGIIFNGTDGTYVKNKADGLREDFLTELGVTESSGKKLTYTIKDIDGLPVPNAVVRVYNDSHPEILIDEQTTDDDGVTSFLGLYNDTFTVKAYYTINTTTYLVNSSVKEIDLPLAQLYETMSVTANLTTATFYAKDSDLNNPDIEWLYNVSVSITNKTSNEFLIFNRTEIGGRTTVRIPATEYNVSVKYLLQDRQFSVDSGPFDDEHTFSIASATEFTLDLDLIENSTRISINNTEYLKESQGWGHSENVVSQPYYISMYRGDSVNITFYYENTDGGFIHGLASPNIESDWLVTDMSESIIDGESISGEMSENPGDIGNYSIIINTNRSGYEVGVYTIVAQITKTAPACQTATIFITLNIMNQTSSLTYVDASSTDEVIWDENIELFVDYATILPLPGPIDGATANYFIKSDPSITAALTPSGTAGRYEAEFDSNLLEIGEYTVVVNIFKENITEQSIEIDITVNPIQTNISWSTDADYQVTGSFMKVANEENVSLVVNYTKASDGSYIASSTVRIAFDDGEDLIEIDGEDKDGDGLYYFNFNSTDYEIELKEVAIYAFATHYESNSEEFDLEILDYWNTQTDRQVPPSFYPWNNTAEFIFKYFCNEQPRQNRLLTDGTIHSLNVTYNSGTAQNPVMTTQAIFDDSNTDVWGYEELTATYGNGYYRVWFETGELTIDEDTYFDVDVNISTRYYRASSYKPYVWVRPVEVTISPFVLAAGGYGDRITEEFQLYLDQSTWANITLNVTDEVSDLYGNMLAGAEVNYTVTNITGSSPSFDVVIPETTIDADTQDGWYLLKIDADWIGEYRFTFTSSLQNYAEDEVIVDMTVLPKIISTDLGDFSTRIITQPENQPFTLSISLTDQLFGNAPLTGATVTFEFNGQEYEMTETGTAGTYTKEFTEDMLVGLGAEESDTITITISKPNYGEETIDLTLNVGLPVDPWLGLPFRYWYIIGGTIGAMVTVYSVSKGIAYSRIPEIIKQIDKTIKQISKNKKLGDELLRPTRDAYIAKELSPLWDDIDVEYPSGKGLPGDDINSAINEKKEGGL